MKTVSRLISRRPIARWRIGLPLAGWLVCPAILLAQDPGATGDPPANQEQTPAVEQAPTKTQDVHQLRPTLSTDELFEKSEQAIQDGLNYLVASQNDDGSWPNPPGNRHSEGTIYNTCLATLMLEVYYRYLPGTTK